MEEVMDGDLKLDKDDNAVVSKLSVQRRVTGPTRRSAKGGWTEQEDKLLQCAVAKFNGKNWKKIAEHIPHRTDVQCLHRWQKVLNPDLVKGPWTKQEDNLILKLVEKQGNKKWSEIAKHLPGRIGKQCRERWHNHLNPEINRMPWTKEEELVLIRAHGIYGNKWAEIAKLLHGRSENSIKNHWNCSVKKRLDVYSAQSLCSYETPRESGNIKVVVETPDTISSLHPQKERDFIKIDDTCCLDLLLGNCGSPKEKPHFAVKPPQGTIDHTLPDDSLDISLSLRCPDEPASLFTTPRPQLRHMQPSLNSSLDSGVKNGEFRHRPSYSLDDGSDRFAARKSSTSKPPSKGYDHIFTSNGEEVLGTLSSPESILRSAAKCFRNPPSIIRKRGLWDCRHSVSQSQSDKTDESDSSTRSVQLSYLQGTDDLSSEVLSLPKSTKPFVRPLKSRKLENSIGKSLVYEFDAEWDLSTSVTRDSSCSTHGGIGGSQDGN